jgi:hypothetical protein
MWQNGEEDGIGEPALLIEGYADVINITQSDGMISINYETLEELIKTLRAVKKDQKR